MKKVQDDKTQKRIILAVIVAATVIAWVYLVYSNLASGEGGMVMDMSSGNDAQMEAAMQQRLHGGVMSVSLPPLAMFVSMWTVMCIAMMLPTAIPMILCMHRVCKKDGEHGAMIPVWMFILGYAMVWVAFGLICWLVGFFVFQIMGFILERPIFLWLSVGALFLLCGIYQLSPLKNACLKGCQHPLAFLMENWQDGAWGGAVMGIKHGVFCAGCCAGLMVVMFPLGMMNLVWMCLFTLLMYFEKNAKIGTMLGKTVGWLLTIAGVLSIAMSVIMLALDIRL